MEGCACWYAVHTKPHKEQQVQQCLESRGIETYLPALRFPNGRPLASRVEPFFARYLFAHLDPACVPLSSINWSPGVTSVVSFGGQPAVVSDRVIAWLKERLADADPYLYYDGLPLRPNERLRVSAGPFRGMEAIFDRRLSADGRARVLVTLLGQLTACELPLGWLQRL